MPSCSGASAIDLADADADERRRGVDREQRYCRAASATHGEGEGDDVQAVGEVMDEHGDGDDQADLGAGFEAEADGHAVERAVGDQAGRREPAELRRRRGSPRVRVARRDLVPGSWPCS